MIIAFEVATGTAAPRRYRLANGQYTVGSGDCDIVLSYPTVSRRHGQLTLADGIVSYMDLSSRNGTLLLSDEKPLVVQSDLAIAWSRTACLLIGPFTLSWSPAATVESVCTPLPALQKHAQRYSQMLTENPGQARDLFWDELEADPLRAEIVERIQREYHGDGPLQSWLLDTACREIILNAHDELYVDLGAGLARSEQTFLTRESFGAWAVRTAHEAGRRLDLQHPICEATLPNGARFHAVMPPVSARGISVAIRRFGSAPIDEERALASGWLDETALTILKEAIVQKRNMVISGGTSTGKTSLLNFLCKYLPMTERIVTVEDTVELTPPVQNLVQLQGRAANADGIGHVALRQLVQCALRMRPDRIIVGECRGSEVLEMLQALNTGHPGSLTTVHANSTDEAVQRLELLALLGAPNLSVECIREWIRSSVEVIVQVERDSGGHRHVGAIAQKPSPGGSLEIVYRRDAR